RENFEDLKKLTGNPGEEYGMGDDQNVTKVRGSNLADIAKAGVAEPTHKAAINTLLQRANDLQRDYDKIRTEYDALQKTLLDLNKQYQVKVDTQVAATAKA